MVGSSHAGVTSSLQSSQEHAVCPVKEDDNVDKLTRIVEQLAEQVERMQQETRNRHVSTPRRVFSRECWTCHQRGHVAPQLPPRSSIAAGKLETSIATDQALEVERSKVHSSITPLHISPVTPSTGGGDCHLTPTSAEFAATSILQPLKGDLGGKLRDVQLTDPMLRPLLLGKESGEKPSPEHFGSVSRPTCQLLQIWEQLMVLCLRFEASEGSFSSAQIVVPTKLRQEVHMYYCCTEIHIIPALKYKSRSRHDYIGVVGRMAGPDGEAAGRGDERAANTARPVVLPETFNGTKNWDDWYFH